MFAKIHIWWDSLPHAWQVVIMLYGGAAAAAVKHSFADTHGCIEEACLKGYLWAGLHGGIAAVVALEIPSNLGK